MANAGSTAVAEKLQQGQKDRPAKYRFVIEVLLFFSYFVFGLSWIGYSPFLKEIQTQFHLAYASVGLVISAVSFAKIFVPMVAGYLALRVGVSRTILIGMACICASLLTPFSSSFRELLATRVIFGVGGAILVTLIGPAVMQWFPRGELAIVNGFNYVAVNSGITLSLFITIPLAERMGRKTTLAGFAVVSAAIAAGWLLFGKDRGAAQNAPPTATEGYGSVLRMKEAWWLTFAGAGPLCIYLVFNTWLPTFYSTTMGMTRAQAAQLTGLANMVGIPTAIIGGILTRKAGRRKPFIVLSGLLTGIAAFGLFLTRNLALLSASAVVFGIGLFLWIAPLTTLAMELPGMTPRRLAMLNGFFYSVGYLAAFLAPVIAGALRDQTGSFIPGFVVFAVFSWSLALAGIMLPETGSASKSQ
jgi:CP family cyanate transporter-like MFS transporter